MRLEVVMLKVLVVYSYDDDTSQMRYTLLRDALRKAPFEFEQCFALPSSTHKTTKNIVNAMVSRAIDQFKPDVLLIHTGAAYSRGPEQYTEAVIQLHQNYPNLRFGLERRYAQPDLKYLALFEMSDEMQSIERAFFR
jgi:hypothetical protein